MPVTDLIKAQVGQESSWGTCVVATAKLMGVTEANLQIVDEVHQTEKSGSYYPSDLVAEVSQMGKGSISMDLSYEDILYPLDNFFDEESPTGTTTYTWAYDAPSDTTVTPNYLSIEFGAPSAEYEACGVLFTELNISGEAGGIWVGEFPFVCSSVAAGAMASLSDRAVELIRMADTEIYIDTWSGTIGSTKLDDALVSFELSVNPQRHVKQFAGEISPQSWGDGQWTGTLTTVLEFVAGTKAYVDALLGPALVQRMIRIAATSAPRSATIDFYGTLVNGAELFEDRDGNITVSLEWQGTYNDTDSAWLGFSIVNLVASLT
ncbi:MAG: hypothetical protein GWN58_47430 [Anaerolineae bacterium]|nr:hypothetical protein [Anaerolineae bacterium]